MKVSLVTYNTNRVSMENKRSKNYQKAMPFDSFLRTSSNPSFKAGFREIPVHCPGCGGIMVTAEEFASKLFEQVLSGPSTVAIDVLKDFEKSMHQTEKSVFKRLKNLNKHFPELNLQQSLLKILPKHFEKLKSKQIIIINNALKKADELPEQLKKDTYEILEKSKKLAEQYNGGKRFKRKAVISAIDGLIEINPDNKTLKEISRIVEYLPNSNNSVDSFVVKYSERKSREIGQRLVSPSIATKEHLNASHNGGINDLSNYFVECAACNSHRHHTPLNKWVAKHPKMLKYIRIYMKEICAEILADKSFNNQDIYLNYPRNVLETLKVELLEKELKEKRPNLKIIEKFESLLNDLQKTVDEYTKERDLREINFWLSD